MIDCLVQGRIFGKPAQRTGPSGKPFTVAKLRTAARDGEALFVSCIAFAPAAQSALLALADGDAVALAGELSLKVWTDKDGTARPAADLLVHQALSAYAVTRKRQAATSAKDTTHPKDEAWRAGGLIGPGASNSSAIEGETDGFPSLR